MPHSAAALVSIGADTSCVPWRIVTGTSRPAADLPQVGAVIKRQATPSCALGNIGILGYPGPNALARAVANMRRCDKLACG